MPCKLLFLLAMGLLGPPSFAQVSTSNDDKPSAIKTAGVTVVLLNEVDSNALRKVEPPSSTDLLRRADIDALLRLEIASDMRARLGTMHIGLRATAGGKAFLQFVDEDMAVFRLDATAHTKLFGETQLMWRSVLKARGQLNWVRTYAWNQSQLSIRSPIFNVPFLGRSVVEVGGSGSGFASRQLTISSYMGTGGFARMSFWPSSKEHFDVRIGVNLNAYPYPLPIKNQSAVNEPWAIFSCTGGSVKAYELRADLPANLSLSFTSKRTLFFSARFIAMRNPSNSCGESFTRYRATLLAGFLLPAQFTLSLDAALQFTSYDDGIGEGQQGFLQRDDESQNRIVLRLKRPLFTSWISAFKGLFVEGRASYFSNEFSAEQSQQSGTFSRMVLSVGMGGTFEATE